MNHFVDIVYLVSIKIVLLLIKIKNITDACFKNWLWNIGAMSYYNRSWWIKSVTIIRDLIIIKKIWHLEKSGGLGEHTAKQNSKVGMILMKEKNRIGAFGFCGSIVTDHSWQKRGHHVTSLLYSLF